MSQYCNICGKPIVIEEDPKKDDLWADDFIPQPKKKLTFFCQLCEAKLRKEADDIQKPRKPI